MQGAGSALMGIGSARGEDRAVQAAELAISSPLLEASIDGAHGVLLSIQGGSDLGLFEINEAARLVHEAAHAEANIIFGAVIDDALGDEVRVTVIAAGFDGGSPQVRKEGQGLGQVQSAPVPAPIGASAPTSAPVPAQVAAATSAPAAITAVSGVPRVPTTTGQHAGLRPVVPIEDKAPGESVVIVEAENASSPVDVPHLVDEEPLRDAIDDLDVPDFLK
jgi:cell division protein FtsZ